MAADTGVAHIVWDWNGTLLADSTAAIEATIEVFTAAAMPHVTRALYRQHNTRPISLFYERLAGRGLSAAEHEHLVRHYMAAYTRRVARAPLDRYATRALAAWRAAGGRQSLLSMHPHESLVRLVEQHGIADQFTVVDGCRDATTGRKAPHLGSHLARLGIPPGDVVLVGDSVDDALAARECGVRCVMYHAGAAAVHTREHLEDLGVPVVDSLEEAVAVVAADAGRTKRVRRLTRPPAASR